MPFAFPALRRSNNNLPYFGREATAGVRTTGAAMLFSFALLSCIIFTPAHARLAGPIQDEKIVPVDVLRSNLLSQEIAAEDVDGNDFLAVDPELPESVPGEGTESLLPRAMSTQREADVVSALLEQKNLKPSGGTVDGSPSAKQVVSVDHGSKSAKGGVTANDPKVAHGGTARLFKKTLSV